MVSSQPHFLLISGAESGRYSSGRWRFLLESVDGRSVLEASDEEQGVAGERLELLAVVHRLEALEQPSRVTLVTSSRHVSRGFRFGLEEWRQHGWRWEHDGRWVPVKNRDLWQRVDRALAYHRVECRTWRLDQVPEAAEAVLSTTAMPSLPLASPAQSPPRAPSIWSDWGNRLAVAIQSLWGWPLGVNSLSGAS